MVLTRSVINQNIKYHDFGSNTKYGVYSKHHTYYDLSRLIDAYKNLFIKYNAKPGMTVVIGEKTSTEQIAMVFACAELGLSITIAPNVYPAGQDKYVSGSMHPTLKMLLPIDFYIIKSKNMRMENKHKLFSEISNVTIRTENETLDYTPNNTIYAENHSVFLKCTTSGTTGTPKIIEHTHEFLYQLLTRNKQFFYGNMATIANLNHGSSPATYFLPGLMSEKVNHYFNFSWQEEHLLKDLLKEYSDVINHIMFPYTVLIDEMIESNLNFKNCVIYTLSIIRKEWIQSVKDNRVKDFISIFGSNETSGPTMINQATDVDFTENTYKLIDDFYKINISSNSELEVIMPVYNKIVSTNDKVEIIGNKVKYIGRSNLYRINDLEIDMNYYQSEVKKLMGADLIVDTNKNRIYLAIWDKNVEDSCVTQIDSILRNNSNGLHYISHYERLNYNSFLSGIKLDNEALRQYFREKF